MDHRGLAGSTDLSKRLKLCRIDESPSQPFWNIGWLAALKRAHALAPTSSPFAMLELYKESLL